MASIFNPNKKKEEIESQEEEQFQQQDNTEEMNEEAKNFASNNLSSSESEKLEAVRDLLFGQNIKEYRGEFDELKKIIKENNEAQGSTTADLKSELIDKITNLENKFDEKVDEMNRQLNEKLDQLTNDKADRNKMATILHDLASRLED